MCAVEYETKKIESGVLLSDVEEVNGLFFGLQSHVRFVDSKTISYYGVVIVQL